MQIEPGAWPSWCSVRVGDVLVVGSSPAGAVRSRAATRACGCAAASATEATVASSGEQWRAGVRAVRRAGFFRWARSVGVSGEAAGREKLVKTPAPAQEVGVSRRRPLARAPCLRGSEFFRELWERPLQLRANLEMCTLDGCAPCFTAILNTHGCNYRILATPPCKHAPFWLPSSQCSHPPADGCTGWKGAKMARAGRAEWLGSCNCSHAY